MGRIGASEATDDSYRLIVENLTDGVVTLDRQARARYANPSAKRILDEGDAELLGKVLWEIATDPLASALRSVFDRIPRGEDVLVLRNFFAQGRWFEAVATATADDRVLLVLRDITERLQAEAARRQSEERCRIMVEGVKDHAIFLLGLKTRVASWNRGAERITGYRAIEAMKKDIGLFLPAEKASHRNVSAGMLEAVSERGFHYRGWLVRQDESQFFGDVTINAVYDELGQPTGFACVMRDITEQERMDRLLRLSEERLRLAAGAGEIGIWEYVVAAAQFEVDDRLRSIFGLQTGATMSYEDFRSKIHSADRKAAEEHFRQAVNSGGKIHFEYRTLLSQGGAMWVESQGRVLLDEGGKPQRVIGTTRDVTERHRYDEFRELLLGILAHDLRSPLSAIKMAGQQLQKSNASSSPVTQFAKSIVRGANHMARMIDRLLEFTEARFGAGLPVDRAPTDLADIAREVVTEARLAHPESALHFEFDGNTRGSWDAVRLSEVTSNLLGNAIKHGQHGELIDVTVLGNDADVVLKVHNNGPPIPEEIRPLIYEPFVGAGRHPGKRTFESSLGLGLYITRELVRAHGGTIEVSSSAESGTTFTVCLPR